MAPTNAGIRAGQGIERVREHVMTSLHLGRLRPGDRLASVYVRARARWFLKPPIRVAARVP